MNDDIQVIPDNVTELPRAEDVVEETEVTPEIVANLHAALEEQNMALLQRLQILGKAVNPMLLLKLELDVLKDFVFENEEARAQYDTAVSLSLNEALKVTLAQLIGAEVDG